MRSITVLPVSLFATPVIIINGYCEYKDTKWAAVFVCSQQQLLLLQILARSLFSFFFHE